MLRVTADTNIYVSALNFGGKPERLLRLAEAGKIQLVISDHILTEIANTLRGEKFAWPEPEIEKAIRQLSRIAELVEPTEILDVIKAKTSDNRILECAAAAKADYIVTGDTRHILPLGSFRGKPITKVADFLRQLEAAGPSQNLR